MTSIPGPVEDNGDITVPMGSGAVIPIKSRDVSGNPEDISSIPMKFVVRNRFEKMVPADPNDPLGKLLVITEQEASSLSTKGHPFSLLDLAEPTVPLPRWSGTIRRQS